MQTVATRQPTRLGAHPEFPAFPGDYDWPYGDSGRRSARDDPDRPVLAMLTAITPYLRQDEPTAARDDESVDPDGRSAPRFGQPAAQSAVGISASIGMVCGI
jgi:hypothetical protein